MAAGDVTGDFAEDVVVANDEEGRIDRVQIVNNTADDRDSAYDDDDRLGVGDMTGDGIAEVVIANTESNRIDVINYHGAGGNMPSAYDGDDRFAVGTFGSGDLDGDSIPDRVELLGVRDDKGKLLIDLRSAARARAARTSWSTSPACRASTRSKHALDQRRRHLRRRRRRSSRSRTARSPARARPRA